MLSERSQSQKITYLYYSAYIICPEQVNLQGQKVGWWLLCDRVVEWRLTVNEYGVSSRRDKNVLKLDCGDVAQPVNIIVNFKQVN